MRRRNAAACCRGSGTPPLKPWARGALGAAALALANGLHAAGLFLPVGADGDVAPRGGKVSAGRTALVVRDPWERRIRIARHELTIAHDDLQNVGEGRLLLNVRDGLRLNVVVERAAPTKFGYSLSGRVAGGNVGFVTLVVHEEAVAGTIWTPDSAYELNYLGGGVHALRDVTNTAVKCGGALSLGRMSMASSRSRPSSAADATGPSGTDDGGDDGDDGSVVDILVVWTPAAEEEYGGAEPQVLSRIDLLVAYANDAFERSGAFVSLNLVGAERGDYLEANRGTDLDRLIAPDDGHMDGVHDRRDALGADLIYLLVGGGGGIAVNPGAFSIGGGWSNTFAHEIGHNFGIDHERYEFFGSGAVKTHQHGFTTGACSTTIMSYGKTCYGRSFRYLPFYASPWRYDLRDGRALGVTRFAKERGALGPADAVLTLNRNRHRVANYRPSRSGSAR